MVLFDNLPDMFYLGFYHPQYIYHEEYFDENCNFNEYSQTILELKNQDSDAIEYFLEQIGNLIDNDNIILTVVPSHSSSPSSSGICDLAKRLTRLKSSLIDGTHLIQRVKSIDKQSCSTNERTQQLHLDSIKINNQSLMTGKKFILMDDVLTTGNSVKACKSLLTKAGAKQVKIIVLGKTIRNIEEAHLAIENEYKADILRLDYECEMEDERLKQETLKRLSVLEGEYHLSLLTSENDENYYIDQEYQIQKQGIRAEKENESLRIEEHFYIEKAFCGKWANEAHQVIEGNLCFSPNNHYYSLFLD